jgi:sulfate adenylyltransferase subunit 2
MKMVRFRTLGCYPLTGAVESTATTLPEIIQEMLLTTTSERQGRLIDHISQDRWNRKNEKGIFNDEFTHFYIKTPSLLA